MKHIVLYSHGFGVDKTDRGLFTVIAEAIPEAEHIMFEYDAKDKDDNTIVETFSNRKSKLIAKYEELRKQNPNATIDLSKPTVKELPDKTLAVRRRDGSTTLIKQNYWDDFGVVTNSERLYNTLSEVTELIAIRATEDEILQNNSYDDFDKSIRTMDVEGNHSFDNEARPRIAKVVRAIILAGM